MAKKWRKVEEEKLQYPPASVVPKEFKHPFPSYNVSVYVHRVYGCCPVSVEGDRVWTSELKLNESKEGISSNVPNYGDDSSEPVICPIAFASVYPYMSGMNIGATAVDLGIAKSGEDGFVMCPAWGPPTCEALVIFRLHPERVEKSGIDAYYERLAKLGHIGVPSFIFERFASDETKKKQKKQIEEWVKAGKPKFWEGWRNPPCQPRRKKDVDT